MRPVRPMPSPPPPPPWRLARVAMPWLLAAAAGLAGCGTQVVNPVTGKAERSVMDERTEVEEGRKAHAQVLAEYGRYNHPPLQAYVNGLGQRLAAQSHRAQLTWTFTVLDSPEINAFALPGGYVYVTRGIMAYLDSEAELAGVIGHEIGHVTARHGAQRATRQQDAGLGVFAATVAGLLLEGAGLAGAADLASQASQNAAAGYVARYSREQELQADKLGAEYLVRNRYDPQNMVDVIQVLKNQERFAADQAKAEGRALPQGNNWLASHPSNDQRLADIRQIAAGLAATPSGGTAFVDEGRQRYLAALQGVTFGDGREQGVVRGRTYYHEPLGFTLTAPEGWRVNNSAEAISIVDGSGQAGLIVQLLPDKAGSNHDEIIRNLFKPVDGRSERRTVHGLPLTHFSGNGRNPQGQPQAVRASVLTGPQQRHYLLRYAARDANALQRALPGLREAEGSFRAMTAADQRAASPWVVKLAPFPRGGFAELARQSPMGSGAEAHLRLINSVYGQHQDPAVDQVVKVVVAP